ncbi:probable polygalacturonase At3g15720 [Rhododendron vialii]|uniref:probable polygalacturonase At3g15720 n=1 Tax=Rhododendron vialii TaxID=182163 RepID=UPI0026602274|nr:probable polygalacturonase At3g15720 [Rhododendron vialii]
MHRMALVGLLLIICIASFGIEYNLASYNHSCVTIYDVMHYGAVGDGRKDDSQAFIKAWKATCGASGGSPILKIPDGKTFFLKPLAFEGPCKSSHIQVQISGTLMAPGNRKGWSNCQSNAWLYFSGVNGLSVYGNGQINGQGSCWWKGRGCYRPTALRFHQCNNLRLTGLSHKNSARNHISISDCKGVTISRISISAPENSPNTDGIDISMSTHVSIRDSRIGTGDDCVAINTGSSNINITGVSCGPGHGISVGSLGAHGSYSQVEWVRVQGCSFTGTKNGGRVKTWPGGSGYARHIYYENITLNNVKNPIIIDQDYCNGKHNCPDEAKAVQVSDVYFSNWRGTSAGEEAITLDCSSHAPCRNIMIEDVDITSSNGGSEVYSICKNAHGRFLQATPAVSCA